MLETANIVTHLRVFRPFRQLQCNACRCGRPYR
jgi:hypothetical protein